MDDRHYATPSTIGTAGGLLLVSVLFLATPLNLVQGYVPTPLLPFIVIFLYAVDRPASLPPWLTFSAGLLQDFLFGAAVGPWATVYLLTHAAVIWQRSYFVGRDRVVLATGFSAALSLSLLIYWVEMSILGDRPMPVLGLIWQGVVTIAVFLPALYIFRRTIGRQRPSLVG